MYFLIKSLKLGKTVVFESVLQRQTWILGKDCSRMIEKIIELRDAPPELKSTNTVHLFDASAGANSYPITRIEGGAFQVVFSSTNIISFKQFYRCSDVYIALLPSLQKKEFFRPLVVKKIS
jgi:hypothetical protein